ncbi:hypothetical protein [Actinotalea sp. C106]|uniref:hypothetical protein n=1 Tax=Actinotalea sp. C106 TaxID=2908644 RepID=UPI0020281DB4|nr:hypothetical protein [Actinotalea sp. C106]
MTAPSRLLVRAVCAFALAVTTAVAGAVAAAAAPAATGEPLLCTGFIQSQQVYSDVRVPDGATCSIHLVGIHGNLLVDRGGSVRVTRSSVVGDLISSEMASPSDGGSCQGRRPWWSPDAYVVSVGRSALLDGNGTFQLRRLDVAEYLACVDNGEILLDAGDGPGEPLVTAGLGRRGQC